MSQSWWIHIFSIPMLSRSSAKHYRHWASLNYVQKLLLNLLVKISHLFSLNSGLLFFLHYQHKVSPLWTSLETIMYFKMIPVGLDPEVAPIDGKGFSHQQRTFYLLLLLLPHKLPPEMLLLMKSEDLKEHHERDLQWETEIHKNHTPLHN